MSERVGPVVWFSYWVAGADEDEGHVEEVAQVLPDAFSLFAAGSRFQAVAREFRYGVKLLTARAEVQVDEEGAKPVNERVAGVRLYDPPRLPGHEPVEVVVLNVVEREIGAALAMVPHMELLAQRALEWAQAHASAAPMEE